MYFGSEKPTRISVAFSSSKKAIWVVEVATSRLIGTLIMPSYLISFGGCTLFGNKTYQKPFEN